MTMVILYKCQSILLITCDYLKISNFFLFFLYLEIEELAADLSVNDDLNANVNTTNVRSNGEARTRRQRRKGFLKRLLKFLVVLKILNRN